VRARTGQVTPAPDGPHVEQVGWGVARQVVRVLRESDVDDPAQVLERLPDLAETPGFLAYAVFERRTATAAALVELPSTGDHVATYRGDAVTPTAQPGTREALVIRALHDVANAGVPWLAVPEPQVDLRPLGFA
jgi:hypothetical protein